MFECDMCDRKFNWSDGLLKHKQSKHLGLKHKCNECDYESAHQSSMKRHANAKHRKIAFNCSICSFKTVHDTSLNRHVATVHGTLDDSVICPDCNAVAKNMHSFRMHWRTQHSEIREKYLETRRKKDMSKYHQKMFQCDFCDWKGGTKAFLIQHLKSNHK